MGRRPFVVGNWKMNHTRAAARDWRRALETLVREKPLPDAVEIGVAPPFTSLGAFEGALPGGLRLGAQDLHWEAKGAFTGEISAEMLREAGCDFAIVGHSERRQLFGETDERAGRKVAAARAAGLEVILCVGETENEREAERTAEVVERQLRKGLERLASRSGAGLVVAYEPVWAIGTGRVAAPAQAQEVHAFLRSALAALLGEAAADEVRILYGGSVSPKNAAELAAQPDVDGFLVGGASLEASSFHAVALAAERAV